MASDPPHRQTTGRGGAGAGPGGSGLGHGGSDQQQYFYRSTKAPAEPVNQNEVQKAFSEYDRQVRISNSKLGAVLAIIMMPAGASLDWFVYPDDRALVWHFLKLRLLCSFLVGIVLALFLTPFGKKHYRVLGMTWYMLPAFFIAWMIYVANDPVSPYYAGLNLVVLAIGLILPWTYKENLLAVALVLLMYLGA